MNTAKKGIFFKSSVNVYFQVQEPERPLVDSLKKGPPLGVYMYIVKLTKAKTRVPTRGIFSGLAADFSAERLRAKKRMRHTQIVQINKSIQQSTTNQNEKCLSKTS